MDRWSRRWKAGEQNKEQLRALLDDVSKKKDWPKGSIDQQVSDFYGGCMDAARIDAAGTKPIQPLLAEIKAVKNRAELQRVIARLHALQMNAPFGITSTPDNHNPSSVIAKLYAAGLGLPDRDYYFKPDKRFAEAREKYVVHVAKMFQLAGWTKAAAKQASETVFAMETRLASAQLDNVALRDPAATDHKVSVAALQQMTPHFEWNRYLDRSGVARADLNVDQPAFMAAVDKELTSAPLESWKTYLQWNVINAAALTTSRTSLA